MTSIKYTCSKCKKEFNHIVWYKGKMLCRNCYRFSTTMIPANIGLTEKEIKNIIHESKII